MAAPKSRGSSLQAATQGAEILAVRTSACIPRDASREHLMPAGTFGAVETRFFGACRYVGAVESGEGARNGMNTSPGVWTNPSELP
jgi:hypothetical protein